jgi:hypothetical protein
MGAKADGQPFRSFRQHTGRMVTPGRLELPAYGLGNRRSILLSYGVPGEFQHFHPGIPTFWPVLFRKASRFAWIDSTNRASG